MSQAALDPILKGRRSQPQQLIEVLQDIQKEHGHVSKDAMTAVSRELGVPVIEVYRVAKFYKAFSLKPRGKHLITLCLGTACHVRGSNPLLDQALSLLDVERGGTTSDGLFTVEAVNCLGACALGPIAVLDGEYHQNMSPGKLRARIKALRQAKGKTPAKAKGGKNV